ncbi:MAG TPA: hypothetical protein QF753_00505 [Victivallales bacterium]|nr:hypothetical protein [Victivallales bacterium]
MVKEIIFFLYGLIGFFVCFNFLINYKGALHELIAVIFFIIGAAFFCSMALFRIITSRKTQKAETKLEEHEIQDIRQIQILDCVNEIQKTQNNILDELINTNKRFDKILKNK